MAKDAVEFDKQTDSGAGRLHFLPHEIEFMTATTSALNFQRLAE